MIDTNFFPLATDELRVRLSSAMDSFRPQIADGAGPRVLTEAQLDRVTPDGSKPGMVGDGRQPHQSAATR